MKLNRASVLTPALLAGMLAALPAAQAQGDVIVVGGDASTSAIVSSSGMTSSANGASQPSTMATVPTGHMVVTGPITAQGVEGDWSPQLDVPVISGLVVDNQIMSEKAYVSTPFGYSSVPTSAGLPVIIRDQVANWLTVPVGQVVSIPLSTVVRGPLPHKVTLDAPTMPSYFLMMNSGTTGSTASHTPFTGTLGSTGVSLSATSPAVAPDQAVAVIVDPMTGATETVNLTNNAGTWSGASTTLPASSNGYIVTLYTFDKDGNVTSTTRQMVGGSTMAPGAPMSGANATPTHH